MKKKNPNSRKNKKMAAEEEFLFQVAVFRIMHVIRNTGERKSLFEPILALWAFRAAVCGPTDFKIMDDQ